MAAEVLPNEAGTPDRLREVYGSDEILEYDDGRWGDSGYAMPNGQGKSWTVNSTIWHVHNLLGQTMFELMHREDAKFADPPHKNWWWEWQLAIVDARRNIAAMAIDAGTSKTFDAKHVTETPQTFLVYPVPFWKGRVRQADIRWCCEMTLKLLGEIQQHSANERSYYITGNFARLVNGWLNEIHMRMAVKYFGYDRKTVMDKGDDFQIEADRFGEEKYRPEWQRPQVEQTVERPPRLWWPTENDLSKIRGIDYTVAIHFARRHPVNYLEGEGAWETAYPNAPETRVDMPDTETSVRFAPDASVTEKAAPGMAPD